MESKTTLIEAIDEFSKNELKQAARYYDQMESFPTKHVETLFSFNILTQLHDPKSYVSYEDYLTMIRLVSQNFPALGSIFLTQESHCIWPLITFGTERQKNKYLEDLLTGAMYGSFALNEPVTGSEMDEMSTVAVETDEGWLLSGRKEYISNSPIASVFLIAAKTKRLSGDESFGVFIVERNQEGVTVGETEKKMGIKALPVAGVTLSDVLVDASMLLGEEINGLNQVRSILNRNRLSVAAQSLGIAEGAFSRGLEYVSYERNLGKRLIDLQNTQFQLADIQTRIFATKALLTQVIRTDDQNRRYVAMTKLTSSNLAIETAESIINMTGGYGYMRSNDIERYVRDAKITAIYGSSSARLRRLIAKPWVDKK